MPRKSRSVKFSNAIDDVEEQYIRSGGKDPYVLTLLTRGYSDGKKAQDESRRKGLTKNFETMKESLIRQYNDVELENVKLQYELLAIQQNLKSQLPDKNANEKRPGTTPKSTKSPTSRPDVLTAASPVKLQQTVQANVVKPGPDNYLSLVQTRPFSNFPFSFGQNMPHLPNFPFGNTYIVTGDEVYINGMDVDVGEKGRSSKNADVGEYSRSPVADYTKLKKITTQRKKLSSPHASRYKTSSPIVGLDGDWESEAGTDVEYNTEPFFEINRTVPQGQYDFNAGILIFFDFVTKLPKEARFCRLSVALITAGRMKPPISFTALPTEQYSPGDHPEFTHFTTVCRFAFCLSIAGGKPSGPSSRSGVSLVAEVMVSPDKPIDDQAPVLGWIRHGWAPISATRKVFDDDPTLTTYAGRFRTLLRKALPLTRGADGLLEFTSDSKQERVGHRTELFYRIVNAHQAATERLAPVDVKYIGFYDEF